MIFWEIWWIFITSILNQTYLWFVIHNWLIPYLNKTKSYFLSFLGKFSDFKSHFRLKRYVVFFGPDWLGIPCRELKTWYMSNNIMVVFFYKKYFSGMMEFVLSSWRIMRWNKQSSLFDFHKVFCQFYHILRMNQRSGSDLRGVGDAQG